MALKYTVTDIRGSGTYEDVDVETLREIPLPPPGKRTKWYGVKHGDLVDGLALAITKAGITYERDTWTLSGKGERLHGYIDVSLTKEEFEVTRKILDLPEKVEYDDFAFDDIDLCMGVSHSNDSTMALYLTVVPRVKEWNNGITVEGGNISLCRRHTKSIGDEEDGLENAIEMGLCSFLIKAAQVQSEIKMLKSIALTEKSAYHIMVAAAAKKVITWSSIHRIQKLWKDIEQNAWGLYMCFSRIGTKYNIGKEIGIITRSRKLILELCEENKEIIEAEDPSLVVEKEEISLVCDVEDCEEDSDNYIKLEDGDQVAIAPAKETVIRVPEEVINEKGYDTEHEEPVLVGSSEDKWTIEDIF